MKNTFEQNHNYISVNNDWYDSQIESYSHFGFTLGSFNVKSKTITGTFSDVLSFAHRVEREYRKNTTLFRITKKFLSERDNIVDKAEIENGEFVNVQELDLELDKLENKFELTIKDCFIKSIICEYERLTNKHYIK